MWLLIFGLFNIISLGFSSNSSSLINSVEDDDDYAYYPHQQWSDIFDWKLFKTLSSSNPENILISPISLKLVLALLYEGSGGNTEREFQEMLQFSTKKEIVRENFRQILSSIQASERKEYILNLGSRIFLDSGIQPQQHYAAKALDFYQTPIEATNFSNPVQASQTINSWIDKLTNGKVAQLVKADNLKDDLMIITNAVYFKGTWRHKFPKEKTKSGGFYVKPDQAVQANFMTTVEKFYFAESADLDAKILRLPYKGNRFALFVILPNSKAGLAHLIQNINLPILKQQLFNLEEVVVAVSLPKFKFNFQASFVKTLKEYGLQQMFQNTASFPGIARGPSAILRQLVVNDIIQKTGIELDEEGSEVHAATDVQIGNKFGDADNVFNATHPFMFFIEEQTSGTVLFVGKVERPSEVPDLVPVPIRSGMNSVGQALPLSTSPNLQPENPQRAVVLQRFNYFDLELLYVLTETHGNVFISPASIKTTLALILEGAQGKSAHEIGNALRIEDINRGDIREILNRLLFDLNDRGQSTLVESSNALFVSNKLKIHPQYQQKVGQFYKANIQNVDFSNPIQTVNTINTWASKSTHGLIGEIVGYGNINPDTNLVLANTLYFKGKWKSSFDAKSTKLKCFNSPSRGCVNTPLMLINEVLNTALISDLNAHAIELPYEDDKYAMLVLVPAKGNDIKALARDIQHSKFGAVLDLLRPSEVIFEMPRFTMDYNANLIQFLRPLKIQDIFGSNANLTGIIDKDNVRISAMLHKTRIEVNEQGTKAAAATAAIVIPLMGSSAQRIVADHPFIFFIYHRVSRNIIFEGMFMEPSIQNLPLRQQRFY